MRLLAFVGMFSTVLLLSGVSAWAAPDHAQRPDCAMTGNCAKSARSDALICRNDGRCRVAPPNWTAVVLQNAANRGSQAPGGFSEINSDLAAVPLPPASGGLVLALVLLFRLRHRARLC